MNITCHTFRCALLAAAALALLPAALEAQARNDLAELRDELAQLRQMIQQRDQRLEELQQQIGRMQDQHLNVQRARASQDAIDQLLAEIDANQPQPQPHRDDIASMQLGAADIRLTDISLILLSAAGSSTARGSELVHLQGGAHDPNQRGFNFQQAELSIGGAVDPLFYAEAHIVFDDQHVELEEGFLVTQSLPWGLQLKGGYFLTEFGRVNPQHPHEWQWIDQPLIATRLFSGEGTRGAGARVAWLAPLPWYSQLYFGMQNPGDDTMISFLGSGHSHHDHGHDDHDNQDGHHHDDDDHGHFHGDGIGGRPTVHRSDVRSMRDLVYLLRWANAFDLGDDLVAQVGLSGMMGPNPAGPSGETWIYGSDLTLKWQPAGAGWPYVTWQTEIMQRQYRTSRFTYQDDDCHTHTANRATLRDWGLYSQLLYGLTRNWAIGLRGEFATGSGGEHREDDPLRSDRYRISPLVMWQPTEFSRVRLQYNYDRADFLHDSDAHSVWLGVEVLLGSHPAHGF